MSDIRASIDIGSNSILLLVVDFSNGFKVLANESNVTSLGKGLDQTKRFAKDSMQNSLDVLIDYANKCKKFGVNTIIATATEASRVASNATDFYKVVSDKTGINVILLSGEGEAFYSTKGILFNTYFDSQEINIMDIGGASTELIKVDVKNERILKSISMPIGAVRVTNWIEEGQLSQKLSDIYNNYAKDLDDLTCVNLHCVAGTMTSVANMHLKNKDFIENQVHGHKLSTQEILQMYQDYKDYDSEKLIDLFPFLGKRSKTIVGGLVVACNVFEWLKTDRVIISTYGLRYGTILSGRIEDEYKCKWNSRN